MEHDKGKEPLARAERQLGSYTPAALSAGILTVEANPHLLLTKAPCGYTAVATLGKKPVRLTLRWGAEHLSSWKHVSSTLAPSYSHVLINTPLCAENGDEYWAVSNKAGWCGEMGDRSQECPPVLGGGISQKNWKESSSYPQAAHNPMEEKNHTNQWDFKRKELSANPYKLRSCKLIIRTEPAIYSVNGQSSPLKPRR